MLCRPTISVPSAERMTPRGAKDCTALSTSPTRSASPNTLAVADGAARRAARVPSGRRTSAVDAAAFDEAAGEDRPVFEVNFHLRLQAPGFTAGIDVAVLLALEGPFAVDGDIA